MESNSNVPNNAEMQEIGKNEQHDETVLQHPWNELKEDVKEFINTDFPLSGNEPNKSLVMDSDNEAKDGEDYKSIVPKIDTNFPLSGGVSE